MERGRASQWTLLATSLGFAVVQLDVSVVNVAIRPIGSALGGDVGSLQWIVNAYTVSFAALILTAGALGDRIGAKRVFLAGFAIFTAASAACGLAPDLDVLIAARCIQGMGAAILVPCSLALLNHTFRDADERTRAVGLWAAGAAAALSAGPLVGGILTDALGWRSIFFINAPIGIAGIWLTARYARETSRTARAVDVPGLLSSAGALTLLAWAIIEGGERGFGDGLVLAALAAAVVLAGAFVACEATRDDPMLPLGLFRSHTFSAASAIGLLMNVAFYGLIFVLSLYFQQIEKRSPLETGLAFAPTTVAVMAANVLAGRAVRKLGSRAVMAAGALLVAVALVALLRVGASTPYAEIVLQLVALGFGLGLIVPPLTAAVLASADRSRSGIASGTLNTARQVGSTIGVALFGSLIAGHRSIVSGLHSAIAISIGLALAVAALSALIEDRAG
jgi:DHA2 family methylenomycin A resistance protein-like MFS transporter